MGIMKPRESRFKVHQGLNMMHLETASDTEIRKEIRYFKAFRNRTFSTINKTNCEAAIEALNAELDRRLMKAMDDTVKEIQIVLKGIVPKDALLSAGTIDQDTLQIQDEANGKWVKAWRTATQ